MSMHSWSGSATVPYSSIRGSSPFATYSHLPPVVITREQSPPVNQWWQTHVPF